MKKLSVLFVAMIAMMSFGTMKAQKIATLDVASVLNLMPEKKKADEQLQILSKTKQADLEKQMQAAQAKLKQYQEDASKQTQAINDARQAELQKLQENIQQLSQAAQKDLAEKTDTAYAPIEKKFNEALSKVAKANSWDFVFDTNTVGLLYKGGADATPAVKKELGL